MLPDPAYFAECLSVAFRELVEAADSLSKPRPKATRASRPRGAAVAPKPAARKARTTRHRARPA
jgi:hypothetical protein